MPISQTAGHSEQHWADVQTLLHRAIAQAGMVPSNVWAGDLKDRVSERIIGNIFRHDVIVADISDLNPNVMLELGLRLASKKPTIVVVEAGGTIPFDIRDFHALQYPPDLNIIGMEKFFSIFATTLRSKLDAYRSSQYKPFLGDMVVEVLEPSTKNVSAENLIIERLDEIGRRISRIEQDRPRYANAMAGIIATGSNRSPLSRRLYFRGSATLIEGLAEMIGPLGVEYDMLHEGGISILRAKTQGPQANRVIELAEAIGLDRLHPEEGRGHFPD